MPARDYTQLPELPAETFLALKDGIENGDLSTWKKISQFIFQRHKLVATKDELGRAFAQAVKNGKVADSIVVRQQLRSKPTRTLSGVVPVTVLTKPFPCPGKCIFCPNDIRMPKSYLSQEPGAQRASHNFFDPYLQTYNRLQAFANTGHSTDKVELIILGGTWSYYPEEFQRWFIWQCFQAMNDFGAGLDQRDSVKHTYQKVHELFLDKSVVNLHEVRENKYNRLVSEEYVAPERKAGLDKLQTCTWEELEAEQRKKRLERVRRVWGMRDNVPSSFVWTTVTQLFLTLCWPQTSQALKNIPGLGHGWRRRYERRYLQLLGVAEQHRRVEQKHGQTSHE